MTDTAPPARVAALISYLQFDILTRPPFINMAPPPSWEDKDRGVMKRGRKDGDNAGAEMKRGISVTKEHETASSQRIMHTEALTETQPKRHRAILQAHTTAQTRTGRYCRKVCRLFHSSLPPHLRCISVEDAILERGEAAANVHCAAAIRSVAKKYAVFEPRVSCGLESLVTYRHMFLNLGVTLDVTLYLTLGRNVSRAPRTLGSESTVSNLWSRALKYVDVIHACH